MRRTITTLMAVIMAVVMAAAQSTQASDSVVVEETAALDSAARSQDRHRQYGGTWHTIHTEADELTGTTGDDMYEYIMPNVGRMVIWNWNDPQFAIVTDKCIFSIANGGAMATIGLYNTDGTLFEKIRLWLDNDKTHPHTVLRTRNKGTMGNPVGQASKVRRIFHVLTHGKGHVRIILPRYDCAALDMRVPPYM